MPTAGIAGSQKAEFVQNVGLRTAAWREVGILGVILERVSPQPAPRTDAGANREDPAVDG